ncbi:hypothetical protein RND81_14G219000 [Saponaria officinalis]|uniref:Retrotransposon gag domain-containing protein n=1 Tax=Saponaria officinalis TaxID=3572 RepID=A0AAW1H0J5_SAPOF
MWTKLSKAFLLRFFPPGKTAKFRNDISTFVQEDQESLYEAWERFSDLLRQCPHHGIPPYLLVITFYNGIRPEFQIGLDAAANGAIDMMAPEAAMELIEKMTSNSHHWEGERRDKKKGRESVHALNAKIDDLTAQINRLCEGGSSYSPRSQHSPSHASQLPCQLCGELTHDAAECLNVTIMEQANAMAARQRFDPYSNTYNPGYDHHSNMSYGNNQGKQGQYRLTPSTYNNPPRNYSNQPPGFQNRPPFQPNYNQHSQFNPQYQNPNPHYYLRNPNHGQNQHFGNPNPNSNPNQTPPRSKLKSLMEQYAITQGNKNDELTNSVIQLNSSQKIIENQLSQLAQQLSNATKTPGAFPGNTEPNPKGHVNAIHLRSGRVLDDVEISKKKGKEAMSDVNETVNETPPPVRNTDEVVIDIEDDSYVAKDPPPPSLRAYVPLVPFPQRLAKAKLEQKYGMFIEILKSMNVNIPFLDVISEMPSIGKFLKELISKKHKVDEVRTVNLSQECSAILLSKLPPKLEDPGSFSIPCSIQGIKINKALCDLGASVSLMPLPFFKRLKLTDLKPTWVTL